MKKSNHYVGIDISKLTFDVAIYNQDSKYRYYKFSNNEEGFNLFLTLLNTSEDICVMEASGVYYLKLATFLSDRGIAVSVINPLVIRRFSQMRMSRAKTDKKDAMLIAEYGKTQQPDLWEPEADYVLELKQMFAYLEQLNKNKSAFSVQNQTFKQNPVTSELVKESIRLVVKTIETEIKQIEKAMEQIIKTHYKEMLEHLKSIPGIGTKTSLLLIVISGGFSKFENHKQLASYVGISPRIFESGTSVKGRSKICKMGMSKIRAMLYVCAWSAKRCNKSCSELYDRLVEKGKAKKLALIAVVNKLLKQAFAIATKKEYYLMNFN